jgi:integrase
MLLYLTDMLSRGRKVSTVDRHSSAINFQHREVGLPSPGDHRVRELIRGARRLRGEKPTQKTPLTIETLRLICEIKASAPGAIRDRSILTLAFGSALRRANLCALDLGDLQMVEKGLLVNVKREKNRQKSGRQIPIARGLNPDTCPIAAFEAWIKVRGQDPGPLYVPLINGVLHMRRLRGRVISAVVKAAVARVGMEPASFGAHSTRRGFVTTAFENGVNEIRIAEVTGHRSLSSLRGYLKSSDPFRGTATALVGL